MKKIFSLFLILAILSTFFTFSVSADTVYKAEGFTDFNKLFDANRATYTKSVTTATVTMTNEDLIGHVYIEFDRLPNGWKITADGVTKECGEERFLHDYIDVKSLFGSAKKSLLLNFPKILLLPIYTVYRWASFLILYKLGTHRLVRQIYCLYPLTLTMNNSFLPECCLIMLLSASLVFR